MRKLQPTPKGYVVDSDKILSPAETVARAKAAFGRFGSDILAETRRIDTGRLGIPVYLSVCGETAREVMPTRKQMGKGACAEQAEASALMELAERFSFFHFWNSPGTFEPMTWSEANAAWPGQVMSIEEIVRSVNDAISPQTAAAIMDLVPWRFVKALNVTRDRWEYVPVDWFKKINEFNGSSAGNGLEESILQGACELVERHVCAIIDRAWPVTPTISLDTIDDEVLCELVDAFHREGIFLLLKDFSLGMPIPTVAALAYDPATFPADSEIVFTAGTATSPAKAAIRAITEIAQLAGDFESKSNYEASGLPKFKSPVEFARLLDGPEVTLEDLPGIERADILEELILLARGLAALGNSLYSVDITHPGLGLAANYTFVPGFLFRERSPRASVGLFVGRILAEESDPQWASQGLETLAEHYPNAPFLPFFQALLELRTGNDAAAARLFALAEPLQEDPEDRALAAFYQAHALTRSEKWPEAVPHLNRAIALCPQVKEYFNLRGVASFKAGDYASAAADFEAALALDSGSAMDLANLGLCHDRLGHAEQAVRYLETAVRLDPDLQFARRRLEELVA
ncbi:YcaO-like family protein [Desulfolutivibrio sulfoxidireducens]|uniref:YcaO-like family protein n=1 Tax=Desulfolutivibrio sulfoxidireducens TaxID=2773299 RepID=UPI00159D34B8|nr:YcaO-like family protein [Desulfolutivibrio sulfoxidireducens]QLA16551.1 tetratricopeptide repeat protein [Desulfolutivibrio sulfoxidireducens]QLA19567.1 tetratricopeptide repeat protein [Desulfolutivibrio sulfoxidireducens]